MTGCEVRDQDTTFLWLVLRLGIWGHAKLSQHGQPQPNSDQSPTKDEGLDFSIRKDQPQLAASAPSEA